MWCSRTLRTLGFFFMKSASINWGVCSSIPYTRVSAQDANSVATYKPYICVRDFALATHIAQRESPNLSIPEAKTLNHMGDSLC